MENVNVLISGASVGGPALAYFLNRYGFNVTVVERAPHLRPGGQAIDVRAAALDVVEQMGVLDEMRRLRTDIRGMSIVDASGKELYRTTEHTFTGGVIANSDVEILRDDLCSLIYEAGGDGIEYLFDDSITSITQDEHTTRVTFENRAPRDFDIVVGADGLHSNVRRLVFGPESQFIHHLGGSYMGVFTAPNFLDLDHWQVYHQNEGAGGIIMSVRDDTELRVYAGFFAEEPLDYDYRDLAAQKRIIADRLANAGWEFPNALKYMWDAPDFHFDSASQIRMDSWSRGSVVLLGDAGYCGSPLSGQGTSMALIGAYVLAGELKAAGGDHVAAFAAYEKELRGFIERNQDIALANVEERSARAEALADRSEAEIAQEMGEQGDHERFRDVVTSYSLKSY
ncbi:FAD-dependent monooxygenase [Streptantibioticus rubrisoli]|uniref:FAD-dependent monooxygenase n=1 Tax=Streptantibioticus rubrisoli TaxID=1387313 RepID=A0ABT1PJL9_9ACTN|nr:FAD-dependent monooxygenase [Streptantibioticus rubrisoli]MCQ4045563.1 FAD-dependent monooxygenase [Streptantibioticus rubrisoli]